MLSFFRFGQPIVYLVWVNIWEVLQTIQYQNPMNFSQ